MALWRMDCHELLYLLSTLLCFIITIIKQSKEKNGTFLRKTAINTLSVLRRIRKQAARLVPSLVLQLSKPCAICKCLSPMLHAYTYRTCGDINLPQNRSRILCSSRTGSKFVRSNQRHRTLSSRSSQLPPNLSKTHFYTIPDLWGANPLVIQNMILFFDPYNSFPEAKWKNGRLRKQLCIQNSSAEIRVSVSLETLFSFLITKSSRESTFCQENKAISGVSNISE